VRLRSPSPEVNTHDEHELLGSDNEDPKKKEPGKKSVFEQRKMTINDLPRVALESNNPKSH